ncbi:uncharacterized protein BXZ73DRAFT_54346 [Epithele typhae]|uniref:uncharacterized protein n=1 Tax=Epithele typhae TaxID=378194 RepID=UPI002008BFC8|nr:uncharacterized protein BXZ73DRAFT_54346 [Epithele typhae]KAH9915427.1 hypothetical protein BXZ73DRAFT_54346 [Epithele typhae]
MAAVTAEDAAKIVSKARRESVVIEEVERKHLSGFDAFTPITSYVVRTGDGTSYLLKVAPTSTVVSTNYSPNSLASVHELLKLILDSNTGIPTPEILDYDASRSLVPCPYLLLAHPKGVPLALARASGKLSPRQLVMLDLLLGQYLKRMHDTIQMDWFGLPSQSADGLYSWQEAFTPLVEGALDDAEAAGIALPYADLRVCLSRAIGFFLFDDCEVPSLVTFTGDDATTLVDFDPDRGADAEVAVTSFAAVGHALWGDPLLEAMWMAPSEAFVEGYGSPLVLFARQKTKRLWYTLFLALVVLEQARQDPGHVDENKVKWADEEVVKVAEALKTAPCY